MSWLIHSRLWLVPVSAFVALFLIRLFFKSRKSRHKRTVGFFHPYCNAGGGGERVLWCAIRELQKHFIERGENFECVVYTGDVDASIREIVTKAKERFNVELLGPVKFVFLRGRKLVEATTYPHFTLLGQSLGGMLLGLEAICKFCPDIFLDTMGYAFALPVFRFLGACTVGCYVHYPVISTDMLEVVASRKSAHNNQAAVAKSWLFSRLKLIYYVIFAQLYGLVGKSSHVTMVNSSWTYNHIVKLWKKPEKTLIVHPPCDVDSFRKLEVKSENLNEIRVLSIGQFRPEKNHKLQLEAFAKLKDLVLEQEVKLVLVGSCRHAEDKERVGELKVLARNLKIEDSVEWRLAISYSELIEELSKAMIGLHCMWNEHFGIGIVEGMAAGNIMVAHNSGGPKLDIILPNSNGEEVGFLAETASEYAEIMARIIRMTKDRRNRIRTAARESAGRFSEYVFNESFIRGMEMVLQLQQ